MDMGGDWSGKPRKESWHGKQPWIRRPHQKPRQDVSLLACWLAKINFLALAPSQRGWLCKLFGGNLSLLLGYNAAG